MKKQKFKIGMVFLIGILIVYTFRLTIISGYSMEDTLHNNQTCISTPSYFNLKYNDIIVIDARDSIGQIIIKRIIALPGDTVEIKDNKLYLNNEILDEYYLKEPMVTADIYVTLAEDEYFVCGDNRNNSLDSRAEIIGPIKKEDILFKLLR